MSTPVLEGSEFLINTTTLNEQWSPAVAGLANGQFVAVWADASKTGGDTSNAAVHLQRFDARGVAIGGEVLVNTTTSGNQLYPTLTVLSDGRFVVAWTDSSYSSDHPSNDATRAQIFNADGSKAGAEFLVQTDLSGAKTQQTITALKDGGFVVAWTAMGQTSGSDLSDTAIRAQIFNADGSKRGAEFVAPTTTDGYQEEPSVTTLADGRFVLSWSDYSETGGDQDGYAVRAQVFNADGSRSGSEFLVNTTTGSDQDYSSITGLTDGRFVVVWHDDSATGGDTSLGAVRGQIFNPDGSKSGVEFLANTTTGDEQTRPSVEALTEGRFVVAWYDDSGGGDIRLQVFAADGTALGDELLVSSTEVLQHYAPSITALADGRFVVAWSDQSAAVGDTSIWDARGKIFDPRTEAIQLTGTARGDDQLGTGFADRMSGVGGNDSLDGAGGNDALFGGAGGDRLLGDGGQDKVNGGKGKDSLTGGSGADDFIFSSKAEATGDRIMDFRHKVDDINLQGFMKGGEFIGGRAFTKDDDQVRYVKATGLLQGDVNGDGRADWSLTIGNKVMLTAADFIF
ncbi:calcium-binding protein [Neogemmobacter tilapiae]|uniref:Calcium-binding protein n=1 Tax=Neogemmobacter tilapiae TaxID=875041 RepID=A0A918TWD8_9RHOB|nr:hypothetical protein [Gemmobacter tilapiae]GHC59787.1 hypothetical protein GCM10007315_24470 [Gemmobacter tilapiae]